MVLRYPRNHRRRRPGRRHVTAALGREASPDLREHRMRREWSGEQRLAQPEDMIGTALFLASPASAFLTGQILYVDGGFTAMTI